METNQNKNQNQETTNEELYSWNRERSIEELRNFIARREVAIADLAE